MKAFATRAGRSVAASKIKGLSRGMALCLCLLLGAGLGCDKNKQKYVAPPPAKVTVAKPVVKTITEYTEFTGNTKAYESVDIKAGSRAFWSPSILRPAATSKRGSCFS